MLHVGKKGVTVMLGGLLTFGVVCQAAALEFSLTDTYGRRVTSQDYEGIPLLLEFGPCW